MPHLLRLSLSTGILYHMPLSYSFALARDLGLEGVELVLSLEVILRGTSYIRRLCEEYAVHVLSVHPPIVPYPGASHTSRILPRLASLARAVGAEVIVLHTPKVTSTSAPHWIEFVADMERARDNWPEVCVSLENSGFFRESDQRYLLHDLHRLRAFADMHDLTLTLDTAHAGTVPVDLGEAYEVVAQRLVNVHLSDLVCAPMFPDWQPLHTLFRHHQMPGEGELDLDELARQLVLTGFSGPITLELSPAAVSAWSLSNVYARMEQAVDYVRQAESAARRL